MSKNVLLYFDFFRVARLNVICIKTEKHIMERFIIFYMYNYYMNTYKMKSHWKQFLMSNSNIISSKLAKPNYNLTFKCHKAINIDQFQFSDAFCHFTHLQRGMITKEQTFISVYQLAHTLTDLTCQIASKLILCNLDFIH